MKNAPAHRRAFFGPCLSNLAASCLVALAPAAHADDFTWLGGSGSWMDSNK